MSWYSFSQRLAIELITTIYQHKVIFILISVWQQRRPLFLLRFEKHILAFRGTARPDETWKMQNI